MLAAVFDLEQRRQGGLEIKMGHPVEIRLSLPTLWPVELRTESSLERANIRPAEFQRISSHGAGAVSEAEVAPVHVLEAAPRARIPVANGGVVRERG